MYVNIFYIYVQCRYKPSIDLAIELSVYLVKTKSRGNYFRNIHNVDQYYLLGQHETIVSILVSYLNYTVHAIPLSSLLLSKLCTNIGTYHGHMVYHLRALQIYH